MEEQSTTKQSATVKVAAIQCHLSMTEVSHNIAKMSVLCEEAATAGAKIIVFPELAVNGFLMNSDQTKHWKASNKAVSNRIAETVDVSLFAESIPGPSTNHFCKLAKRLGVYIALTLIERDIVYPVSPTRPKGRMRTNFHNSLCFISPDGELVAHYRKKNLWSFAESSWATAGKKLECFDTEYGRVGFSLGMDINSLIPEFHDLEVWTVLNPMCWSIADTHEWFHDALPKTILNHFDINVVCANWTVESPQSWSGFGMSTIYGGNGKILASTDILVGETIVFADLPVATINLLPPRVLPSSIPHPHSMDVDKKEKEKKGDEESEDGEEETVRVAAIQCSAVLGDLEGNMNKLTELCEEAALGGAKIIALPEAAVTGYLSQDIQTNWHVPGKSILRHAYPLSRNPVEEAVVVPGPVTDYFCALSKRLGVYIAVPFVEKALNVTEEDNMEDADEFNADNFLFFNTICLVSPKGELVGHYRKNNPWPHPENSWATAGKDGVTFDTEYGRVGLAICFDVHIMLDKYANSGLWALLYPIAWVDGAPLVRWFHSMLPDRVKNYRHFVIGANWSVDKPYDWYGYGCSTIISPEGQVLATSRTIYGSEVVFADLPVQKKQSQ